MKYISLIYLQYFNKCDDRGAAFKVFDKVLELPPSKTWNLLGKELIILLQFWLDAVRKHLITHNVNWWSFLKHLLHYTKVTFNLKWTHRALYWDIPLKVEQMVTKVA